MWSITTTAHDKVKVEERKERGRLALAIGKKRKTQTEWNSNVIKVLMICDNLYFASHIIQI